jgi:hypothetical protein
MMSRGRRRRRWWRRGVWPRRGWRRRSMALFELIDKLSELEKLCLESFELIDGNETRRGVHCLVRHFREWGFGTGRDNARC